MAWIKPRFETGPRVLSFQLLRFRHHHYDLLLEGAEQPWASPSLAFPRSQPRHTISRPAPSISNSNPPGLVRANPSQRAWFGHPCAVTRNYKACPPQRPVRLDTLTPIHPPAIVAPCRATALVNPRQSDTLLQPIATGTNQPQPIYTHIFLHWCITAILCIDSHSRRAYSPASDGKKSPPHSPPLPNSRTAAPAP